MLTEKFTKSSFSGPLPTCVEVKQVGDDVAIRNSRNRRGNEILFTADEWSAFTAGVKNGEFDIN